MELKVHLSHPDAKLPTRESIYAAGVDLYAPTGYKLDPGERKLIGLGLSLEVPGGFYGRLVERQPHALKFGIQVLNGIVESNYREEVKVLLFNSGTHRFIIAPGDVVAQLIVEAILTPEILNVAALD